MKNSITLIIVLFLLFSCEKQEEAVVLEDTVTSEDAIKAISYGNGILKAGYGFNVLTGEDFDTPLKNPRKRIFRTNNFPKGTEIVYERVKDEKVIERVLTRNEGFGVNLEIAGPTIGPIATAFAFNFSSRETLTRSIASNSSSETIIVRATIPIQKHEILGSRPILSDEAKAVLASGPENFTNKYGAAWVSSEVGAIEVLHVFNFDLSNLSDQERFETETLLGFAFKPFFNLEVERRVTRDEKILLRKSIASQEVTSSLRRFAPRIFDLSKFNSFFEEGGYRRELQRMIHHANTYPQDVTPLTRTLRPYVDPDPAYDNPTEGPVNRIFRAAYREALECKSNLEKWSTLKSRLEIVYKKSKDQNMRARASRALQQVASNIRKAENCRNSTPPSANLYGGIRL
ncbi:hypothetical protein [Maribacter sp. 2-571]|uniref:hypothetical protein n=1 Tax=Maribacter sp. 2-571 TaxID=3417569 RepID=UPI003D33000F